MHNNKPRTGTKPRRGVVLNEKLALEIYKSKPTLIAPNIKGQSVPVSRIYNVSPKTVRDIWSRKTWAKATSQVFSAYQVSTNPIS